VAPIVTELLLRQTKSQMRLVDEMSARSPTLSKLEASKVRKMSKGGLLYIASEYDLDVDISNLGSIKKSAVIASLAALGLLKNEIRHQILRSIVAP
jgi:hypothetical protein